MTDAREYLSADRDVAENRLRIMPGGNGDWYVVILRPGERIGVSVRVSTSGVLPGEEHVGPAVAALHRAMRPADPDPVECTGVAATWCPVHGDCSCPYDDVIGYDRSEGGAPDCPLHGLSSEHAHEGDPR